MACWLTNQKRFEPPSLVHRQLARIEYILLLAHGKSEAQTKKHEQKDAQQVYGKAGYEKPTSGIKLGEISRSSSLSSCFELTVFGSVGTVAKTAPATCKTTQTAVNA